MLRLPLARLTGRAAFRLLSALALVGALGTACLPAPQPTNLAAPRLMSHPAPPLVRPTGFLALAQGPIPFPIETNAGQAPPDAAFVLRLGAARAAFTQQGPSLQLVGGDANTLSATVDLELVGATPHQPVGTIPAPTFVNVISGPAEQWQTHLPTFHQVAYQSAWDGVDVLYERAESGLKSTYVVQPGADPTGIRLAWRGATSTLDEDGSLRIETPPGILPRHPPVRLASGPAGEPACQRALVARRS